MRFYDFWQTLNEQASLNEISTYPTIEAEYMSSDGAREKKVFSGADSVQKAREFVIHWVGENPDLGSDYAVSFDGIGRVRIRGYNIRDLMEKPGWRDRRRKEAEWHAMAKKITTAVDGYMRALGGQPVGGASISPEDTHAQCCWDFKGDKSFRVCYNFGNHIEWDGPKPIYRDGWQVELNAFKSMIREEGAPFSEKEIVATTEEILPISIKLIEKLMRKMELTRTDLN